jgi:hypothetical protein
VSDDNGLKVASLLDLAGTKASVVQLRPEKKDYLDLDVCGSCLRIPRFAWRQPRERSI